MEQVLIVLAIIVFSVLRGAKGSGRRRPRGPEIPAGGSAGGGSESAVEDAQRRAVEALRRWEERQGLGRPAEPAPPVQEGSREVRLRPGDREALFRDRAGRQRRTALADIAALLTAERPAPAAPAPSSPAPREAPAAQPTRAATRGEADAVPAARAPRERQRSPRPSGLARLDRLPLPGRAIVYAEIFGPPKSA